MGLARDLFSAFVLGSGSGLMESDVCLFGWCVELVSLFF